MGYTGNKEREPQGEPRRYTKVPRLQHGQNETERQGEWCIQAAYMSEKVVDDEIRERKRSQIILNVIALNIH